MRVDAHLLISGQADAVAALDQLVFDSLDEARISAHFLMNEDENWKMVPKVHPGECKRCLANTDPDKVPLHPHCRCKIVWQRVRDDD
jgi:hypothetical protein